MSGPERQLPPLRVIVTGDSSGAVKAMQEVSAAAKAADKSIAASGKKTTKEQKGQLDQRQQDVLDFYKNTAKMVAKADKDAYKLMPFAKKAQGEVTKFRAKAKKDLQGLSKDMEKEFRQQGKLLPAFARIAKKGTNRGSDLNSLVSNAEKEHAKVVKISKARRDENMRRSRQLDAAARKDIAAEDKRNAGRQKAADTERAVTSRADQERARQVALARKQLAAQSKALETDELRVLRRSRIRKRDRLRAEKAEAERQTKDQASRLKSANARLQKQVQSGAKIQAKQAEQRQAALKLANDRLQKRVQDGIKIQARQQAQQAADDARVLRRSRMRLRNRLLEQKKQAEEQLAEQARVTRRMRIRQRDRLVAQKKAAEEQIAEDARVLRRSRVRLRDRLRAQKEERERTEADRISGERRALRRSRQRTVRQLRARRDQAQSARDSLRSGFDGGSMMGARADIYMHKDTLQSMASMAVSLIKPFAEVENYTIQMEAFAGSAEQAQKVVEELQKFAIASPYKLEGVLEASTTMMKYGANAEHALEMTKLLGNVAAGNTDKLRLMALAVGQAEALGRLQGQELRQMVNAGFNPLTIAARELAGPGASDEAIKQQMQIMQDAMRRGQLDAGLIEAALQIATSKGGDFAGLTQKQAASLSGLASQILETLDLASIEVVKVFAGDLKELMKTTKNYVDALIGWMKTNKDAVKEWTLFGLKVAEVVVTLSAAAMGLAWTKWVMGSMITLFRPLVIGYSLLTAAVTAYGNASVIAWLKSARAAAWSTVRILGGVAAIGISLHALTSERGFAGLFEDAYVFGGGFLGFMWNIGHNITKVFEFISQNWNLMLVDMLFTGAKPIEWLARLVTLPFGASGDVEWFFADLKAQVKSLAGNKKKGEAAAYDTSMFKFGGPGLPTASNLISKDNFSFLEPYITKDVLEAIKEKPNINFNQFLGKLGGPEGGSAAKVSNAPEHALRGSSEHALRMYQYGESARATQMATKQAWEKKQADLLAKIEQNTRPVKVAGTHHIVEARFVPGTTAQ